jgi:formylmethanofuran dehydrogenase subunit C
MAGGKMTTKNKIQPWVNYNEDINKRIDNIANTLDERIALLHERLDSQGEVISELLTDNKNLKSEDKPGETYTINITSDGYSTGIIGATFKQIAVVIEGKVETTKELQ